MSSLLEIKDLHVNVEEKEILKGLSLSMEAKETHVIMGPNGAGKSTLGNALMGNPKYEVTAGSVSFEGKDLLAMPVNERAKAGLFMSFQNPIEVPGISLENFIRQAQGERTGKRAKIWTFHKELLKAMQILQMEEAYAERDLNVGFSGGEKKKAEILQLLMLKPALAILDETDSGLDVDAVRTVSAGVAHFQESADAGLIIITHSTAILSSLKIDRVHILVDGKIVDTGGAEMVEKINREGFSQYEGTD